MNRDKINQLFGRIPTHVLIIFTMLLWVIPTLGLLITSFRPVQDINSTGWWTVLCC
jgi:alpha-glucoside transport system permease protein